GVAVDGDDIWLVGNYVGNHPGPGTGHVWRYDTLTDTWHAAPDLPEKRGAGAAAIVGRQLHFFGGMDETRMLECNDHWSLDLDDPEANWVARASMSNGRNHLGGVAVGGKVYAVGGQHGQEAEQDAQSQVECYDPATDTWTDVAPLPDIRSHIVGCTFAMNGKIIVLGGEVAFATQRNTVYSYDPATNKWSLLGTMPAPRSSVVSGAIDARTIISTTGNTPDATTATWIGTLGVVS
ncbi:MAG: hypothetical protein QOF78_2498, partial [Phycisphaerales bacterium]|nr:hypothetical protein [Phycisphaerales bacterium]